ncbi:hypothetical protein BHE90_013083, partial [Fusarium euwallaceae]
MADRNLAQILAQLKHSPSMSYPDANALLSKAKLALLKLNAATFPVGQALELSVELGISTLSQEQKQAQTGDL